MDGERERERKRVETKLKRGESLEDNRMNVMRRPYDVISYFSSHVIHA